MLQTPRTEAQDYRIVDPLDPLIPGAVNIWSPAVTNEDIGNGVHFSQGSPAGVSEFRGDADEIFEPNNRDLAAKPGEWANHVEAEHLGKYIPVELIADENDFESVDQNLSMSSADSDEQAGFSG